MSESTAQDKPNSPEKQVLVDEWYLRALEDSAILYEAIKPVAFASSEALRATRMALDLEKRGRNLADELSDLDRRLWKMNEADLRRQIKRLKLIGKLKGAGGVLVGGALIFLTVSK